MLTDLWVSVQTTSLWVNTHTTQIPNKFKIQRKESFLLSRLIWFIKKLVYLVVVVSSETINAEVTHEHEWLFFYFNILQPETIVSPTISDLLEMFNISVQLLTVEVNVVCIYNCCKHLKMCRDQMSLVGESVIVIFNFPSRVSLSS